MSIYAIPTTIVCLNIPLKLAPNFSYCDQFQPTFNEAGLCYTLNNVDLGKFSATGRHKNVTSDDFVVRNVKGCGKQRGLRVVIDSQTIRHKYTSTSVTRFGEFSPLWQNLKRFWQYFEILFRIWHTFEPTLTNLVCNLENCVCCKWRNIEK